MPFWPFISPHKERCFKKEYDLRSKEEFMSNWKSILTKTFITNTFPKIDFTHTRKPWWHSITYQGEYEGPKYWWAELGYVDHNVEKGHYFTFRLDIKENDPYYINGPAKKGESFFSHSGEDTSRNPASMSKVDSTWKPLKQWQQEFHDSSPQIKAIKEKYDISKEHPGMPFIDNLADETWYKEKWQMGSTWAALFQHFTITRGYPRFTDSPMGESCHEKALAAAKYMALIRLPTAYLAWVSGNLPGYDYKNIGDRPPFKLMAKYYLRTMPWPAGLAAMWGATTCLSCSVREKNDYINYIVGAVAVGTLKGNYDGFAMGFRLFIPVAIAGVLFNAFLNEETGLQGAALPSTVFKGPLGYRNWDLGNGNWFKDPDFDKLRDF